MFGLRVISFRLLGLFCVRILKAKVAKSSILDKFTIPTERILAKYNISTTTFDLQQCIKYSYQLKQTTAINSKKSDLKVQLVPGYIPKLTYLSFQYQFLSFVNFFLLPKVHLV